MSPRATFSASPRGRGASELRMHAAALRADARKRLPVVQLLPRAQWSADAERLLRVSQ